jgi:Mn2+/Fe2+ NRAMP family transporter
MNLGKLRYLGPGIVLAGAAIGVSHLVQATRAGADYGFSLLWLLLLACLTKFPFLQIGSRYAAATGENLVQGYLRLGRWAIWTFVALTAGTMFIVLAAVTMVSAGIAEMVFNTGWDIRTWSAVILAFCVVLLLFGRYKALDLSMKLIISVLTVCTLIAVLLAAFAYESTSDSSLWSSDYLKLGALSFIIALMGWMPIPLDAAVWQSIWTLEKKNSMHEKVSRSNVLFDFNTGYLAATLIGVLFLSLGALVMYGSSGFSDSSVQFSGQLIDMYAQTLGDWSKPLIMGAALITMLSTTLAVTDAYPRVMVKLTDAGNITNRGRGIFSYTYNISLFIIPLVALFILTQQRGTFKSMVDFATSISFLSAPILAYMNLRVLQLQNFPASERPGKRFMALCYFSLLTLGLLSLLYIYTLII